MNCLDLRCTVCSFLGREHGNHDESGDTWDYDAPSQSCTGWFVTASREASSKPCNWQGGECRCGAYPVIPAKNEATR